jgi:cytosine/adenosine deaminase-related metal-dependent hydrolase
MSAISRAKGIRIIMHCAEVKADRAFHEPVSHMPTFYCEEMGLLRPQTVLVHMVHLGDSNVKKLAETRTHVAHCPTSNCKLASAV